MRRRVLMLIPYGGCSCRSLAVWLALILTGIGMSIQPTPAGTAVTSVPRSSFATVDLQHRHARALLDNAMRYVSPKSGTRDESSGYPVEGWNNQPDQGLGLRSFTQLTAIGEWVEVLANVIAGKADSPYLSREEALENLQQVVRSLLQDQRDPQAGARGLLTNFLDLEPGRRMGPLAWTVDKARFTQTFGKRKGVAIWRALIRKGWLDPLNNREASIRRDEGYGAAFFTGPLARFADDTTRNAVMEILDRRTVAIVFGDNVNLSTSVATAIGALLAPEVPDNPAIIELRQAMERFLDNQQEGYSFLFDSETGRFFFGWDASRNRYFGWEDGEGNLQPGHMDYMVNEFRGPTAFAVMRFGLPVDAFANLGFTMKPYRMENGRDVYVLAPWDGSAFQALGLGLSVADGGYRSWHLLMRNVVRAEIDYARRHNLPGFLSECYVGEGPRYTGDVGIPEIAVTAEPRITTVASLYTLGVAYAVAPAAVERFLAGNWVTISSLLTSHGPWEGFDVRRNEPVRIQTSAHTLSLILGLLGTGQENMMRYLEFKGLHGRLREIYRKGKDTNLLADADSFAWDSGGTSLESQRSAGGFSVKGVPAGQVGVAFVSRPESAMNLSNGVLSLRYRTSEPLSRAKIQLKPFESTATSRLPIEVYLKLDPTGAEGREIQVVLPATAGLAQIKEAVLECEPSGADRSLDLSILGLSFKAY